MRSKNDKIIKEKSEIKNKTKVKKRKKREGASLFILNLTHNFLSSLHCSFYYKT